MEQPLAVIAESVHLHYVFIVAHARTHDFAYAVDAANHAEQSLSRLAGALPQDSVLSPGLKHLRLIVHNARRQLSRGRQPDDLEQGLEISLRMVEQLKED